MHSWCCKCTGVKVGSGRQLLTAHAAHWGGNDPVNWLLPSCRSSGEQIWQQFAQLAQADAHMSCSFLCFQKRKKCAVLTSRNCRCGRLHTTSVGSGPDKRLPPSWLQGRRVTKAKLAPPSACTSLLNLNVPGIALFPTLPAEPAHTHSSCSSGKLPLACQVAGNVPFRPR